MRSIRQLKNIKGKKFLVRVDFNVPLKNGKVSDNTRIKETLPTINYLREKGGIVILLSHLGRPDGKIVKEFRMDPIAKELSNLLKIKIGKTNESVGEKVKKEIEKLKQGDVLMLENIRFLADEEKNSKTLAKELASLADFFVLDGFSVAHRAHASVAGVPKIIPGYAGLLLEKEIKNLDKILLKPRHKFVAVIGGAKVETKMPVVEKMAELADVILIGGAMANSCFKELGFEVCDSLADKIKNKKVFNLIKNGKVVLPKDVVVGIKNSENKRISKIDDSKKVCLNGEGIYDIGPETRKFFAEQLKGAKTILWNGAMGYFEDPYFAKGTNFIAKVIANETKKGAFSVAGGGETIESITKVRLDKKFSFISTAGGAMLEYLSGKKLPGIEALKK